MAIYNNNATTFCLYSKGGSTGGDGSGQYEPIPIEPETQYPPSNGIASFTIPSVNHRFSINVNGVDILGTLKDVIYTLKNAYNIYTTYINNNTIIFTINSDQIIDLAIKNVTYSDAYTEEGDYCVIEQINLNGVVSLFTLAKTRIFGILPIKLLPEPVHLDDLLNYKIYADVSETTPLNAEILTLVNWKDGSGNTLTRNSIIHFNNPYSRDVTLGEVIDNRNTETEFDYSRVYKQITLHTLAAEISKYTEGQAFYGNGTISIDSVEWFDFSGDIKNTFEMIKGYPMYLGAGE